MNILLTKFNTPFETAPFDKIKPEDYLPALKEAITTAKKRIEEIKKNAEAREKAIEQIRKWKSGIKA